MAADPIEFPRQMIGICLADIQPERIQWRSRGRIARGKITIIDGDPGLGKSTVTMELAARISRGDPLPDGDPQDEHGVILICAEDDPADTIRPRLDAMGADVSNIHLLHTLPAEGGDRLFSLPEDCALLEGFIRAKEVGLVIIDPFMGFLSEQLKANSDQDIRRALTPLVGVAQRTGASILLVRHLNKSASANALYRGGGSIGIIGVARFGLMVAKNPDDPTTRVLAHTKVNIGPPPASLVYAIESVPGTDVGRVVWKGISNHSANSLLQDGIDDEEKDERDEAADWLTARLDDGPVTSSQLQADARRAGIQERALKRAKRKLGVIAEKQGYQGEWVWRLPSQRTSLIKGGHFDPKEGHEKSPEPSKEFKERQRKTVCVCRGCGLPRSRDDRPCPSCGETEREER